MDKQVEPDWYKVINIDEIDSPAMLVYVDRVDANIQTAIEMVGDANRLRPHIKTHKSGEVAKRMMLQGITKFKCATIAEAELLGMMGAKDVLLAYQPTGPKLKRFADVIRKYPNTRYSCLTDNIAGASEQSTFFHSHSMKVPVYIDLNVGMNRTGIHPGAEVVSLYSHCNSLAGIQPIGLHAYDGHIRNKDLQLRAKDCNAAFDSVIELKNEIVSNGFANPIIVAGGSHTFPVHCDREDVECSPGTFVYWDKNNSDWCPEQNFLPAALVLSRVVSLPGAGLVCTDLGHKSIAAENEITRRVHYLNAPALTAISQSEEHLVLQAPTDFRYRTGDILYGLPIHICPTIALYEKIYTVENGSVNGAWRNEARDRMITI